MPQQADPNPSPPAGPPAIGDEVSPVAPRRTPNGRPLVEEPARGYKSQLLEMLGLDEPVSAYQTEHVTYTTAPAPRWQPPSSTPPQRTGVEMLPSLADMRVQEDYNTDTGTLIERLWLATEQHDAVRPAEELRPIDLLKISGRTFRWSVIVIAVLILVTAVALIRIGTTLPARFTTEATAAYQSALEETMGVLPEARSVVATITDPEVTTEALSDATVELAQLDSAARELFGAASEPLPATPPLVERDELDALIPLRREMAATAEDGLAIERRLGDALTYRLVFERAFVLPRLPPTATPDEASALGVELGLSLAATLDALSQLPTDPFFDAHRLRADQVAARFADWQIEYLTALQEESVETSTGLVAELEDSVADLRDRLALPLNTVNAWAEAEFDRLQGALEALNARLG